MPKAVEKTSETVGSATEIVLALASESCASHRQIPLCLTPSRCLLAGLLWEYPVQGIPGPQCQPSCVSMTISILDRDDADQLCECSQTVEALESRKLLQKTQAISSVIMTKKEKKAPSMTPCARIAAVCFLGPFGYASRAGSVSCAAKAAIRLAAEAHP